MKKVKLTAIACILGTGISIAQPPPPHPGGSGNQGADLPKLGWIALVSGACLLAVPRKKNITKLIVVSSKEKLPQIQKSGM